MAQVITISTSGDFIAAERVLLRANKRLPVMTISAMLKWGNILERDMKSALRSVTSKFTGLSQGPGIEWRQGKNSFVGFLFMRQYLTAVDNMNPHWVSVRASRTRLLAWASQAKHPGIRKKARAVQSGRLKRFGVFVKPHPFISSGFRRARPKLNPILKKEIGKVIKS